MEINITINESKIYNTTTNELIFSNNKEIPIYKNPSLTSFNDLNISNNDKINDINFNNYKISRNHNKNIYSSFSQNNNYNDLIFKQPTINLDNNTIPNTYIQRLNNVNFNDLSFTPNNSLINNNNKKIFKLKTINNNNDNIKYKESFLNKENPNIDNMTYNQIIPDKNYKANDENILNLITDRVEDNKNNFSQILSYKNFINKNPKINLNKNNNYTIIPLGIKIKKIDKVGNTNLIPKKFPKDNVLCNEKKTNNLIYNKIDFNNKIKKNLNKYKEINKAGVSTQTEDPYIDYNISKIPVDDFRSKIFKSLSNKKVFKKVKVIKLLNGDIFERKKHNFSTKIYNNYNINNNNHINDFNNFNNFENMNNQKNNDDIKKPNNYNNLDANYYKKNNYYNKFHIQLKQDDKNEGKNKEIIKKNNFNNNDVKSGKNSYNKNLNNIPVIYNNKNVKKLKKTLTQKILKNKDSKNNKIKGKKFYKINEKNNYKLD